MTMRTTSSSKYGSDHAAQRGSALVVVLGLVVLMALVGAMMAAITGQSAYRVRKTLKSSCALAVAEAGVADAIEIMNTNFAAGVGVSYSEAFGGGSYAVTTVVDTNSGNIVIESIGSYEGETDTTRLELLGDKYAMWTALAGECLVICGGDAILETTSPIINGRVHANGNIFHSSGNIVVLGDLTANGVIQVIPQSGYQAIPGYPILDIPTYLPFDSWRELALNGGLYYEGNQTWGKIDLSPGNGVVYVNGDVEINNQSSLTGTLVASGSISINNRFTQTQFAARWPSLLAGVDVNLYNRGRYTGAIFAGNNITSRNSKVVDGQVMALNNVYLSGKIVVVSQFGNSPIWDPTGTPAPDIVLGGWLR